MKRIDRRGIEVLESRSLFSAGGVPLPPPGNDSSITGAVFADVNSNGVRDAGEAGLANVTVKLLRYNGAAYALFAGVKTNSLGNYSFSALAGGNYLIEESVPSGMRLTTPGVGNYHIALDGSDVYANANFGDTTKTLLSGLITSTTTKAPLAGWTVLLENTAGKVLAQAQTDSTGRYTFKLAAGTYRLVEQVKAGYKPAAPISAAYASLKLYSGQVWNAVNFSDTPI